MLQTLSIKNFTRFSDATFEFSPELNVVIDDNGTGKTHVLALAYTTLYVLHQPLKEYCHLPNPLEDEAWALDFGRKLKDVFKPDKLNHLCRLPNKNAEIKLIPHFFEQTECKMAFSISSMANKINIQESPAFESFIKLNQKTPTSLPLFSRTEQKCSQ